MTNPLNLNDNGCFEGTSTKPFFLLQDFDATRDQQKEAILANTVLDHMALTNWVDRSSLKDSITKLNESIKEGHVGYILQWEGESLARYSWICGQYVSFFKAAEELRLNVAKAGAFEEGNRPSDLRDWLVEIIERFTNDLLTFSAPSDAGFSGSVALAEHGGKQGVLKQFKNVLKFWDKTEAELAKA